LFKIVALIWISYVKIAGEAASNEI